MKGKSNITNHSYCSPLVLLNYKYLSLNAGQLACILLCAFFFYSPASVAEWFHDERSIMGTVVRVELWYQDNEKAHIVIDSVMEEMQRIDQLMSPHIESSELALINREASKRAVLLSNELFELIEKAQRISVLSKGAFDISFASIGKYYDYREKTQPDDLRLEQLLSAVDYQSIQLDSKDKSIRFLQAHVSIDLGGIAKGHAVDRSINLLATSGVEHALVSAGGDTRLLGDKRGRPWIVGIRDPRREEEQAVLLPLSDVAISTSGDYERYFIVEGKRVHHIITPSTGLSAGEVQSVSIIGPDSTTVDALSTTVFVLGVQQGLELVNSLEGIDAIIIDRTRKMHYSNDLAPPSKQ